MSDNVEVAKTLVKQKKFKRALGIIKKLLKKETLPTFELLELESACLFNEKHYQLASIKLSKTLALAQSKEQKLNTLRNLVAVSLKLNEGKQAMQHLIDYVTLDPSIESRKHQSHIVNLALENAEYAVVEKYAPGLISLTEFSMSALMALISASLIQNKRELALQYLKKADGEIRAENSLKPSFQDICQVLDGYHDLGETKSVRSLLGYLEQKYGHERWFVQRKERLEKGKKPANQASSATAEESKPKAVNNVKSGVAGDDPDTVKIIKQLIKSLEAMGAWFHESMAIQVKEGNVSVLSAADISNVERLMRVPIACMPLVNDFYYDLDDNLQLSCKPKKNQVNPNANNVMGLLVKFFNATNKIEQWKNAYPLFALKGEKEYVGKLLGAKSIKSKYHNYFFDETTDISSESIIRSFFGSRVFNFSKDDFRKIAKKFKNKSEEGFIPIIELINHKMGTMGFHLDKKNQHLATHFSPMHAGQEVFVQYNLDDPLVTFLTYGFVDTQAPWVYSIPLGTRTNLGFVFNIANTISAANPDKIPEELKSIGQLIPGNAHRSGNIASLSSLIIPGSEQIHSLKKVIAHFVKKFDIEGYLQTEEQIKRGVEHIERQVIDQNIKFWKDMLVMSNSMKNKVDASTFEQLICLCNFYIDHINNYISKTGFGLKH